ncbi:universal stress domain protein [Leptospira interrogans str. L1207]|nr:universal stress domain protein [Leptospira interrogans str. L1207]
MQRFIKKILVPVDGSESSKKALEMGIAIAKAANASLTILEVVEEFGPLPGYYEKAPEGK